MFSTKLLVFLFAAHTINAASLYLSDLEREPEDGVYYLWEPDSMADSIDEVARVRRQVKGTQNGDGSIDLAGKVPLATGENGKTLSSIGGLEGLKERKNGPDFASATGGLLLESPKGHSLSATAKHIPGFGNELTGSGKVNLLHTPNNKLDATAFATKTMPNVGEDFSKFGGQLDYLNSGGHSLSASAVHIPNVGNKLSGTGTVNLLHTPNHNLDATAFASRTMPKFGDSFNTYGGKMDYMFKDKIGASLGATHNDMFKQTDYSALGKFNVMKTPTSSFDLSGGFQRSMSPYIPHSRWEPTFGGTYTRTFGGF